MLERMVNDEIIYKIERPHSSLDYHWALTIPRQPKLKPLKLYGYEHTRIVGDVYVAMAKTGKLDLWQSTPIKHKSLEEDAKARLTVSPNFIYFEIDRDTQHKGVIASKAERYMKLQDRFHVIFVTLNQGRAEEILDELPKNQGTKFIVALEEYITASPLYDCYVVASRPADFQYLDEFLLDVRTDGN